MIKIIIDNYFNRKWILYYPFPARLKMAFCADKKMF